MGNASEILHSTMKLLADEGNTTAIQILKILAPIRTDENINIHLKAAIVSLNSAIECNRFELTNRTEEHIQDAINKIVTALCEMTR